ncbi:MAG TPA: hypothetical protein DCQ37_04115 [Desulfobacteraceae bacterium]|nr:hypothetical protein [Desulfobacteraceae bacterium]
MANVTPHCEGCSKINANNDCTVYPNPAKLMRWVDNKQIQFGCSFNSGKFLEKKGGTEKVRVGQQKQKKK